MSGHAAVDVMMRLSARYLATHRALAGVAIVGIAIAVASIMATQLLYAAARRSYESTSAELAGAAALHVTSGETGVPDALLEVVRALPGVRRVVASVHRVLPVVGWPGERLYVLGVDLLEDQNVRSYGRSNAVVDDPLVFLAEPDSVALTRTLARAHGMELGSELSVITPRGVSRVVMRAELDATAGPASVLDGRVAVMDLSAAQALLDLDRRYSRLDIEPDPDVGLDELERALRTVVAGRGVVERPRSRDRAVSALLANYRYGLLLASAMAVLAAIYLVFNTTTAALTARRHELGLLRALGMGRAQLIRMVVLEVVCTASVGCLVGLAAGWALARALSRTLAAQLTALYGDLDVSGIALHGGAVAGAVAVGLATALVAAASPLLDLGRLRAAGIVRASGAHSPPGGARIRSASAGAIIVVIVSAVWLGRESLAIEVSTAGVGVMLGSLAGVGLLVPTIIRCAILGGEPAMARVFGVTGLLGVRAIVSELRGVAVTSSALVMSLAGVIAVATWIASLGGTLSAAWDTVFGHADVVFSAGGTPYSPDAGRLDGSIVDEVASLAGVEDVDGIRIATVPYDGSQAMLVAGDATLFVRGRRRIYMVEGREEEAAEALAAGRAVLVNQTFARRFDVRPGGTVRLVTPSGEVRLAIAGIHLELVPGDLGTIRMDRSLYRRLWGDDSVNVVELATVDEAIVPSMMRAIRERWGDRHRLVVLTMRQLRAEYDAMLGRLGSLGYPLTMTALAIALVGVVVTRVSSLLDRVRTIGCLRAAGASRRQISRMLALESLILGTVSGAAAVLVGTLLGWAQVAILLRAMFGMVIFHRFPLAIASFALVAAIVSTAVASFLPARRIARLIVAEAVRAE